MILTPILNYEGKYSITEEGRVLSHAKKYGRLPHCDKWLNPYLKDNGYLEIRLGRGNINHHYIHRLVAKNFLPLIPNKNCVNHRDGNKLNNHYSNLEWCTTMENTFHAWTSRKCKKKPPSSEILQEIRAKRLLGRTYVSLGEEFKKDRETISNIVNRRKIYAVL